LKLIPANSAVAIATLVASATCRSVASESRWGKEGLSEWQSVPRTVRALRQWASSLSGSMRAFEGSMIARGTDRQQADEWITEQDRRRRRYGCWRDAALLLLTAIAALGAAIAAWPVSEAAAKGGSRELSASINARFFQPKGEGRHTAPAKVNVVADIVVRGK
jgi:hypothetical protein